jgi:hypothetical protein
MKIECGSCHAYENEPHEPWCDVGTFAQQKADAKLRERLERYIEGPEEHWHTVVSDITAMLAGD